MTVFMDRLQALMNERELTDKELKEQCCISKNSITNWRKGTIPQRSMINRLADFFGVTSDYLLGLSDRKEAPVEELKGIDFALSGEIRSLTENEKQDLLDYIRFKKSQKEQRHDS